MKIKNIVVIAARGGSKRLPGKNILPLAGKPLISYAIKAALEASLVSEVVVSTDDKKIAAVAKKAGATVPFLRPAELATDNAQTIDVLDHAIRFMEKKNNYTYDLVTLVQTTSPLILSSDIDQAITKLLSTGSSSCVSICEISDRPEWMYKIDGSSKIIPYANSINDTKRSQDLEKIYKLNGAVYVMKREVVKRGGVIVDDKNLAFIIMGKERSVDIDDIYDFELAESILKRQKK